MNLVVAGGGLAGCAAAVRLADAGHRVVLVERHPLLGGKAGTFLWNGVRFDTGQHVATKACTALRGFLEKISAADAIRWQSRLRIPFAAPGGKRAVLTRWPLPAPFHLLPALMGFDLLTPEERRKLKRVLDAAKAGAPETLTFREWLRAQNQGEAAVRRLWEPLVLAVCNAGAGEISARAGAWVIRTGMLESASALDLGIPSRTLNAMTDLPVRAFLAAHGGEVRTGEGVEALLLKDGRAAGVRMRSGEEVAADGVVLALDWAAVDALLPGRLPAARLKPGAILSAVLRLDREILPEGETFVGLVDQPAQWAFAKGHGFLSLVFSGANTLASRPTPEILGLAESSLRACLPRMAGARILDAVVLREKRATFLASPGAEALRPSAGALGVEGLALAGAWTATGWPATMEGAVRSGNAVTLSA